jgi:osmotically inducible protein OsmC
MKLKASAEWKGSLKDGKGCISTESNLLDKTQYSFGTRFEGGIGTNRRKSIMISIMRKETYGGNQTPHCI